MSNTTLPASATTVPVAPRAPVPKTRYRLPPDDVLRERVEAWIDRVRRDEVWNGELARGEIDRDGGEACAEMR